MRGSGYGAFVDILIGIAGAILGGWIMRAVGFEGQGGTIYTILVAIGGAIVLTWIYRLFMGGAAKVEAALIARTARVMITICERSRSTTPYSAFAVDSAAESLRRSRA